MNKHVNIHNEDQSSNDLNTDIDPFLEIFTKVANANSQFKMSITIFCSGTIISGQLVGVQHYITYINDLLKRQTPDTEMRKKSFIGALIQAFTRMEDEDQQKEQHNDPLMGLGDPTPEYIHLSNAVVFNNETTVQIPMWRGRMSSVDGFMVGQFSPPDDMDRSEHNQSP